LSFCFQANEYSKKMRTLKFIIFLFLLCVILAVVLAMKYGKVFSKSSSSDSNNNNNNNNGGN